MATNQYFKNKVVSEQQLYEDIIIEALQMYGQDVYYLPREIINKDQLFLDDVPSRFSDAYKIEMYIENTEGFEGEGDLFTKFGIELRDQANFVVSRKRWTQLIGSNLEKQNFRPREGDLIYLTLTNSCFEIRRVETETPFYQLSQLPTFRLQCELFEYGGEDFDTGIDTVSGQKRPKNAENNQIHGEADLMGLKVVANVDDIGSEQVILTLKDESILDVNENFKVSGVTKSDDQLENLDITEKYKIRGNMKRKRDLARYKSGYAGKNFDSIS